MRLHSILLCGVLLGSCLTGSPSAADPEATPPPGAPLPPEVNRLGDLFHSEVVRISVQFNESIRQLPGAFLVQLGALQKRMQETGDLDAYLAVSKEIERFTQAIKGESDPFEKVPEMPDSALVDKPESLRTLQNQYVKAYQDKGDHRRKQIEDLAGTYAAKLEALQRDLTIKNRIREAIAVKKETERVRKGLADNSFVQQTLVAVSTRNGASSAHNGTNTTDSATATPEGPFYGKVPEWAKWQHERFGNFAAEGYLFGHPDLPDELTLDWNPKNGRGRFSGRCEVDRRVVDMRERAWFGKAILWKIKDLNTLNATIALQSRELSAGDGYGPKAHLVLLGEKGPLGDGIDIPLLQKEITLFLAKDRDASRCTLGCPQQKIRQSVDLPASGVVRVLLAVTVRNPGERCDTTLTMQ
jgi:hypothetical protein